METLEAVITRRSIREYRSKKVPSVLINKLLAAAMQAPSAGNQQPWHFLLVTDREKLNALADSLPYGKMLKDAPIAIIVCVDLAIVKRPNYWEQDCSNATMILLLAAHDQGLGAVWVGVYPAEDRVANLKRILCLPETVIPVSIVPMGYPTSPGEPRESRFNKSRIHRNTW